MNKKMRYLFLLPLVGITSCGYSTSYLVEGDRYTSAVFARNYYTHWDNELKSAKQVAEIDITDDAYIYQYIFGGSAKLINFDSIDPNYVGNDPDIEEYGQEQKMIDVDDSFRYGYQSKLFDGQMICGAQSDSTKYPYAYENFAYQKGRVQVNRHGFSARFSKESSGLRYFAMQFKASTDNTIDCFTVNGSPWTPEMADSLLFHDSKLKLHLTLYTKTLKSIEAHPFVIDVDLSGQAGGSYKTNNGHYYTFIAFSLEEYELSRLIGVSLSFDVVEDALIEYNQTKSVDLDYDDYALFLYEMFFPYTSWN